MKRSWVPILFLLLLLGVSGRFAPAAPAARGASADTDSVRDRSRVDAAAEAVAKQLMDPCPDCKGKLLAGCECGGARVAKDEIRRQLETGKSEAEVVQAFREQYGDWVLAVPEQKGFNRLGFLLPAGLFAIGGFVLVQFLRRAVSRRPRARAAGAQESDSLSALRGSGRLDGPSRVAESSAVPAGRVSSGRNGAGRPVAGGVPLSVADRARLDEELRRLDS